MSTDTGREHENQEDHRAADSSLAAVPSQEIPKGAFGHMHGQFPSHTTSPRQPIRLPRLGPGRPLHLRPATISGLAARSSKRTRPSAPHLARHSGPSPRLRVDTRRPKSSFLGRLQPGQVAKRSALGAYSLVAMTSGHEWVWTLPRSPGDFL